MPPEVLAVVASQQQIHQQLFNQPYSWCIGGGWLLDQEIFQGPTDPLEPVIITGETPGGEPLVFELYVAARLDDWSQIGTLSTEEKQWADNHDYALVFAGGVATGPVGSVELWGMAQSVTDDSGTRFHVFTPHMEGPIVPPGLPERWIIGGAIGSCLDDALDDYEVCLAQAEISWRTCCANLGGEAAAGLIGGCIPGILTGNPFVVIITCGIGAIGGMAAGLAACYNNYSADMASCSVQFDSDVNDCWQDAEPGG